MTDDTESESSIENYDKKNESVYSNVTAARDGVMSVFNNHLTDSHKLKVQSTLLQSARDEVSEILNRLVSKIPPDKEVEDFLFLPCDDVLALRHYTSDLKQTLTDYKEKLNIAETAYHVLFTRLNRRDEVIETIRTTLYKEVCNLKEKVAGRLNCGAPEPLDLFETFTQLEVEIEEAHQHYAALFEEKGQMVQKSLDKQMSCFREKLREKDKQLLQKQIEYRNATQRLNSDHKVQVEELQAEQLRMKQEAEELRVTLILEMEDQAALRLQEKMEEVRIASEHEINQLQEEINSLTSKSNVLEVDNERLQDNIEQIRLEHMLKQQQLESLIAHLQIESSQFIFDLKSDHNEVIIDKDQNINSLQIALEGFQERMKKLEEQLQTIVSEMTTKQQALESTIESDRSKHLITNSEFKAELFSIQESQKRDQLDYATLEIHHETQLSGLSTELQLAHREITILKRNLKSADRQEMQKAMTDVRRRRSEVELEKLAVQFKRQSMVSQELVNEATSHFETEREIMRGKLEESQKRYSQLQESIVTVASDMRNEEVTRLESDVRQMNSRERDSQQRIRSLESQASDYVRKIERHESTKELMEGEMEEMRHFSQRASQSGRRASIKREPREMKSLRRRSGAAPVYVPQVPFVSDEDSDEECQRTDSTLRTMKKRNDSANAQRNLTSEIRRLETTNETTCRGKVEAIEQAAFGELRTAVYQILIHTINNTYNNLQRTPQTIIDEEEALLESIMVNKVLVKRLERALLFQIQPGDLVRAQANNELWLPAKVLKIEDRNPIRILVQFSTTNSDDLEGETVLIPLARLRLWEDIQEKLPTEFSEIVAVNRKLRKLLSKTTETQSESDIDVDSSTLEDELNEVQEAITGLRTEEQNQAQSQTKLTPAERQHLKRIPVWDRVISRANVLCARMQQLKDTTVNNRAKELVACNPLWMGDNNEEWLPSRNTTATPLSTSSHFVRSHKREPSPYEKERDAWTRAMIKDAMESERYRNSKGGGFTPVQNQPPRPQSSHGMRREFMCSPPPFVRPSTCEPVIQRKYPQQGTRSPPRRGIPTPDHLDNNSGPCNRSPSPAAVSQKQFNFDSVSQHNYLHQAIENLANTTRSSNETQNSAFSRSAGGKHTMNSSGTVRPHAPVYPVIPPGVDDQSTIDITAYDDGRVSVVTTAAVSEQALGEFAQVMFERFGRVLPPKGNQKPDPPSKIPAANTPPPYELIATGEKVDNKTSPSPPPPPPPPPLTVDINTKADESNTNIDTNNSNTTNVVTRKPRPPVVRFSKRTETPVAEQSTDRKPLREKFQSETDFKGRCISSRATDISVAREPSMQKPYLREKKSVASFHRARVTQISIT